MSGEREALLCAGCEKSAPSSAQPDGHGYWACRKCIADMKWAIAWMRYVTEVH
jgi:hypothetical protein